jgi:hypothetical protein
MARVSLSGPSLVTIADPGYANTREVRVGSVRADWRVGGIGTFSALMTPDEAWAAGIADYTDLWLRWRAPSGRLWGGIVRETPVQFGRSVELAGSSFLDKYRQIRTPERFRPGSASAGAIIRRAIADAPGEVAIFDELDVDDAGPLLNTEVRADTLYQAIERVARSGGLQYLDRVNDDWTRTLSVREAVGADKTASILFVEGIHFGDGSTVPSTKTLANDILAKSADADWRDAPGIVVQDADSIEARGVSQATRLYAGLHSRMGLAARAREELRTLAQRQMPISFPVLSDEPQLGEVEPGDTVRVWSWSANARLRMTIVQIVDDEDSGRTTLVGRAVPE